MSQQEQSKGALVVPDEQLMDAAADMIRTTGAYWKRHSGPATDDVFANELGPFTLLEFLPPVPLKKDE